MMKIIRGNRAIVGLISMLVISLVIFCVISQAGAALDIATIKQGAEQGNQNAQFSLGFKYDYGKGVPQDDKKAVQWYRQAAEQGNVDGQNSLGNMYALGKGVPQSELNAYAWYCLAAAQGDEDAVKLRGTASKRFTSGQQREAKKASCKNTRQN